MDFEEERWLAAQRGKDQLKSKGFFSPPPPQLPLGRIWGSVPDTRPDPANMLMPDGRIEPGLGPCGSITTPTPGGKNLSSQSPEERPMYAVHPIYITTKMLAAMCLPNHTHTSPHVFCV